MNRRIVLILAASFASLLSVAVVAAIAFVIWAVVSKDVSLDVNVSVGATPIPASPPIRPRDRFDDTVVVSKWWSQDDTPDCVWQEGCFNIQYRFNGEAEAYTLIFWRGDGYVYGEASVDTAWDCWERTELLRPLPVCWKNFEVASSLVAQEGPHSDEDNHDSD